MPSALVLTPVLVFIPLFAFLVPVLFRLMRPCTVSAISLDWFENFQPSCYRPMQGLLSTEDFKFLSRQPGFDPSLYRKLRRERLRIFRQYLNRLILDFNRLHTLARFVVSQCEEDRSDLFGLLLHLRVRFWVSILRVELSYVVCRWGVAPVGVADVIAHVEEISRHLASLPIPKSLLAR